MPSESLIPFLERVLASSKGFCIHTIYCTLYVLDLGKVEEENKLKASLLLNVGCP